MRRAQRFIAIVVACLGAMTPFSQRLSAAEVDVRIVDGLGRPVEGVDFNLHLLRDNSVMAGGTQRIELFRGRSDADGRIRGSYDDGLKLPGDSDWAELEKDGYSGYADSEPKSSYVLNQEAQSGFSDLAMLPDGERTAALRELLASEPDESMDDDEDAAFMHASALRPALRELIDDAIVGRSAIMLLADIGDASDIEYILAHQPKIVPDNDDYEYWENRWAYMVATSAVNMDGDAVWTFLESAAAGDFFDGWVDAGAAFTLWLSDPVRARPALERAATRNTDRREWLLDLASRVGSVPAKALAADDPAIAAAELGPAFPVGRFTGAGAARLNTQGNAARIALSYRNGRDALIYTASYQRDALGIWRLRGVRETQQALLAE